MSQKDPARNLLDVAGQSYAAQAGIRLTDKPAPLYRLLVLSVLLSTRIKADIAVDAAAELHKAGFGTARGMLDSTWQQRVDALGRAHYRRYDEQTATALGDGAQLLTRKYSGDLRALRRQAGHEADGVRRGLKEVPRLGPVGADIFCREAQTVWPELQPYFDKKALDGARALELPTDAKRLSRLVSPEQYGTLAAALVRVALQPALARQVRQS